MLRWKHVSQSNTQFFKGVIFRFILKKERFPLGKHNYESGTWQQRLKLPITIAMQAYLSRFQSFANENEDLSEVCLNFCLSEQNVQQAFQTCQICGFRNLGVDQTRILSLPSLPFSELVPIKHILKDLSPMLSDNELRDILSIIQNYLQILLLIVFRCTP